MRSKSRRFLAQATAVAALLAVVGVSSGSSASSDEGSGFRRSTAPWSDYDYRVKPTELARHANGTPRKYRARGLGERRVDVAVFACDRLRAGDNPKFVGRKVAKQGRSGARISALNGEPVGGSRERLKRVKPDGGRITFEIVGSDGCAQPVVFRNLDRDRGLDIDRRDRATEPFGIGGKTRFSNVDVSSAAAERCDVIDPAVCLLPFPNDLYTRRDPSTASGRRLQLSRQSMPRNRFGLPIDPSPYNRLDGFSPGAKIVTKVPGLESRKAFRKTGAVPITDMERAFDRDQPVVVVNARTGERQLVWSEIDSNPSNPRDVNLIIHPGENLDEGERYIVALRDLVNAEGDPLKAQPGFRLYRDRIITSDAKLERRRPAMEDIFDRLEKSGIARDGLYRAWDFTVASRRSLSERALSIRDDAFTQLGDGDLSDLQVDGDAPKFAITRTQSFARCGSDGCARDPVTGEETESDTVARRVEGQVVVPCYLDQVGCPPGSRFAFSGGSNRPQRLPGNTTLANFVCNVPRSAVSGGADPARPSLYGHGLLGSAGEVNAGNVKDMGQEHNFVFCATDWAGFATQDLPNVAAILQDLSRFPTMVDRTQQGFLNFMYLGRLMVHPDGFASDPSFRFDGRSVIDTDRLFYDGNSQGGILGGSLTALAPDFDRAVLGVPGMNYSTLLRRSVDFDTYAEAPGIGLYANYPSELERPLILSIIQTYWDRGEANGYAHHMTGDPLPDTPAHEVLMHVAFGDHQVANVTAEVEARTIGASARQPALDPGRSPDEEPLFGIPGFTDGLDGSALVYWDTGPLRDGGDEGTPPPPTTNTPPRAGNDPHGAPRGEVSAREQKSKFLKIDGKVVDVCGDHPCYADGYNGP